MMEGFFLLSIMRTRTSGQRMSRYQSAWCPPETGLLLASSICGSRLGRSLQISVLQLDEISTLMTPISTSIRILCEQKCFAQLRHYLCTALCEVAPFLLEKLSLNTTV